MDHYVIAWSDSLSVGDPAIDAQHRKLIDLIARVPDHETENDALLLQEALSYAAQHFVDEEQVMARAEYPELASHCALHKTLGHTLRAYKRDYDKGNRDLYGLKHFLFRWVRDHIMDEDREFGRYLRASRARAVSEERRGSAAI